MHAKVESIENAALRALMKTKALIPQARVKNLLRHGLFRPVLVTRIKNINVQLTLWPVQTVPPRQETRCVSDIEIVYVDLKRNEKYQSGILKSKYYINIYNGFMRQLEIKGRLMNTATMKTQKLFGRYFLLRY